MAKRSLLGALRGRMARLDPTDDFDPEFYRTSYPDLAALSDAELRRHYVQHGRAEGRLGSAAALSPSHTKLTLPDDFDAATYLQLNTDLLATGISVLDAGLHYLQHGRAENRKFRRFNPAVYRELYFGDEQISDEALEQHYLEVGRAQGRIGSAAELLASEGVSGAAWADLIRLQEFVLLNWSWAGQVDSYMQAVRLMLSAGVSRLAPLSFELQFEPAYHRETHPNLADLPDEGLYRHWLWNERAFTPASAAQHLQRLGLPLQAYPNGFLWREYAKARPRLAHRWAALDHLVHSGAPQHVIPPVQGDEGSAFLAALSDTLAIKDDQAAVRMLEAARRLAPLSASALQSLSDCHLRLQHWRRAYDGYAEVARSPHATVWTVCNGAKAAIALERPDLALELLTVGKADFAGEAAWRATVAEAIAAEFAESWREAEALYVAGERDRADQLMTDAAARAAERWRTLDPLGSPLDQRPDGRVVMLANTDLIQCTRYRVDQKAELFEALQRPYAIYAQSEVDAFLSALPGASAAIFYRLPATPLNVRAIQAARAMGVTTYYDIDDLIFDAAVYPPPLESYSGVTPAGYAGLQLGVPLFRAAMQMCDRGVASTTALARHMAPLVRSGVVEVLPNALDHYNQAYLGQPPVRLRKDGEFVIFYGSGTRAHNSDFLDLAGVALQTIMRRHRHVRLVIVGYLDLGDAFDDLRDRITYIGLIKDVAAYQSVLAEADLNLAVLIPDAVTDAKSEIKWLEAAVLGVPSIVSSTQCYRDVLEDGVDALIVSDVEGWTAAIDRMIVDAELRARLVEASRDKLRRLYTVERNAERLAALVPSPAALATVGPKTRVLLVNVFFPPQTIGGATRVMRDNLDAFQRYAADEMDFAVVARDRSVADARSMRVEAQGDLPVFRIGTPHERNMDWRYRNPEVGEAFADVLDLWRPDLVHFHAVQNLTGSVVEVCRERGVPYVVTAHDAWWVSDYQFLSDDKDRLRPPAESWPIDPPAGLSIGDSLARRRYLAPLLEDAAEVLGVSESFAELYRRSGFARARAVPNGTPPMAAAPRTRSASGRVRLAQIGSQTYFKGYHHIQAALKQGAYANLELTVVDHARFGGRVETTVWGETPVRIVGKTPQDQMHDFYAGQDVLLAPSLWPESFGLVSREALSAGLWVLASDRGAIGEDVVPGRNGWVVDVSTPQGVMDALAEINADPERYLTSPPAHDPPLRTSDEQALELLGIYRDVLSRPRPPVRPTALAFKRLKPKWSLAALSKAREG